MLFGSSGIRRRYDGDLVTLALRVGRVLGAERAGVSLGRDTRATGPILADAVASGILAAGGMVHSCGIVPTPAVAYYARELDAGCMITASHNPEQDNGIKLLQSGRVLVLTNPAGTPRRGTVGGVLFRVG